MTLISSHIISLYLSPSRKKVSWQFSIENGNGHFPIGTNHLFLNPQKDQQGLGNSSYWIVLVLLLQLHLWLSIHEFGILTLWWFITCNILTNHFFISIAIIEKSTLTILLREQWVAIFGMGQTICFFGLNYFPLPLFVSNTQQWLQYSSPLGNELKMHPISVN